MAYLVFTDGGARGNPGPAAAAFVIKNDQGKVIQTGGFYLGEATNNQAEYMAVIRALQAIEKLITPSSQLREEVKFKLDSKLVVEQISGRYKIKNAQLSQLAQQIKTILQKNSIEAVFTHIPRSQNSEADALVNQTLDSQDY